MNPPIIEIKNLSKVYTISHEQQSVGSATFRDALMGFVKKPIELVAGHRQEKEKFHALRNVRADIQKGDVVGLIGKNGSGKSTLLKILSRIVEPTAGEIIVRGKSASLLEVGTGFHPELTGRENVFFNGAILGMSQKEIKAKFNEIVAFSGVEKFLDTPVKFYSSGMYVRLAFAVAAHLEPDILMIDEVLAVGDAEFQKKSLGKMRDVTSNDNRTVIFVSHNMDAIQSVCNKCIWLSNGEIVEFGETNEVIRKYTDQSNPQNQIVLSERKDRKGTGKVRCTSIDIENDVSTKRELALSLTIKNTSKEILNDPKVSLDMYDGLGNYLSNIMNDSTMQKIKLSPGKNSIIVKIKNFNLVPGAYSFNVFIASDRYNTEIFDWVEQAVSVLVPPYDYYSVGHVPTSRGKFVYMDFDFVESGG
jgi:lipopolysaccharide transport system ATP-binding protein